eukprot:137171-Chlamydomonas_euryale.AAC.3
MTACVPSAQVHRRQLLRPRSAASAGAGAAFGAVKRFKTADGTSGRHPCTGHSAAADMGTGQVRGGGAAGGAAGEDTHVCACVRMCLHAS